ncbi:MAG TPA: VanZ family protein [Azospira sp.]|nr:VanZ family protein [Azospira sp.]
MVLRCPLLPLSRRLCRLCLALAALTVFLLFYLGAQPFAAGLIPEPWDKLAHFLVFGGITVLLWFGTRGAYPWGLVTLVCLVGAADEWHQAYLPGRSTDLKDWATDAVAAVLAVLLCQWLKARRGAPPIAKGETSCVESSAPSP